MCIYIYACACVKFKDMEKIQDYWSKKKKVEWSSGLVKAYTAIFHFDIFISTKACARTASEEIQYCITHYSIKN